MHTVSFDSIELLRDLDRLELASLIPRLEREDRQVGDTVVRQGESGTALYFIVSGTVQVTRTARSGERIAVALLGPGECFGEMALLADAPRSADVIALTDLALLRLSRANFDRLFISNPAVSARLSVLLAKRFATESADPAPVTDAGLPLQDSFLMAAEHQPGSLISRGGVALKGLFIHGPTAALLATLLVCGTAFAALTLYGMQHSHAVICSLLLGATILWSLDLFSYHAVTVALPLLAVLFGAAPPEQAFSGFSSPSWFLVLGVFAITAAIARTGLMYRLVLLFVKNFPPGYTSQTFALAFSGLLLTPVIPSSNGRAALAGPLAVTICDTLRFPKGSPGAIGVAMACLLGFGHMSFLFMNGTATCYLALGLLPPAIGRTVTWTSWLITALPLGLVFFLAAFGSILLLYRPPQTVDARPSVIDAQLKALGPMTRHELLSLITVVVSLAGFATQPLHRINGAWIAMLSFLILFAGGVLTEKTVRSDIDWNFLISFGALIGFGTLISGSGLTTLTAEQVRPLLLGLSSSPYLFLPVLSLATHLLRFALPLPAVLLIGILSIVPLSSAIGIHPLVIALVLLVSVNPWIVPYQNSIYLNMTESTDGKLYEHGQVRRLALLQVGATLLAVIAAIPWWQGIGLIR